MKKSRYTEEQIIGILKQHEAGVKTADLCREHGISAATFYGWNSRGALRNFGEFINLFYQKVPTLTVGGYGYPLCAQNTRP